MFRGPEGLLRRRTVRRRGWSNQLIGQSSPSTSNRLRT
jgi:hypothetical protein